MTRTPMFSLFVWTVSVFGALTMLAYRCERPWTLGSASVALLLSVAFVAVVGLLSRRHVSQ